MSLPGDNEQPRAPLTHAFPPEPEGRSLDGLEWESELDSAMSSLDSRLSHPRRRASDVAVAQPTLPQLGQLDVTSELLDEIAWRVSEQLRRAQGAGALPSPPSPAGRSASIAGAPLPDAVKPASPAMPEGAALVIRLRKPLFSWRFWRRRSRRRQSMIPLSDYRAS